MKMKVTRAFLLAGKRQEIGTEIDVNDRGLAGLLLHEGKAKAMEDSDTSGPMTTETTAATVSGKKHAPRAKGLSHE